MLGLDPAPLSPMGCLGFNSFTCQKGSMVPPTSTPCSVPLPRCKRTSKNDKNTYKPGSALGNPGAPSSPPSSLGRAQMLRQHPQPSGPRPPKQSWEALDSPRHSPSPRPQLPSFLPARHLLLVPSKRMRRGSLPLPVINASPAQLTPKRPPLDIAARGKRLPGHPLPATGGWTEHWVTRLGEPRVYIHPDLVSLS